MADTKKNLQMRVDAGRRYQGKEKIWLFWLRSWAMMRSMTRYEMCRMKHAMAVLKAC